MQLEGQSNATILGGVMAALADMYPWAAYIPQPTEFFISRCEAIFGTNLCIFQKTLFTFPSYERNIKLHYHIPYVQVGAEPAQLWQLLLLPP